VKSHMHAAARYESVQNPVNDPHTRFLNHSVVTYLWLHR